MCKLLDKENKEFLPQQILVNNYKDGLVGQLWFTNAWKTTLNIQRKVYIGHL